MFVLNFLYHSLLGLAEALPSVFLAALVAFGLELYFKFDKWINSAKQSNNLRLAETLTNLQNVSTVVGFLTGIIVGYYVFVGSLYVFFSGLAYLYKPIVAAAWWNYLKLLALIAIVAAVVGLRVLFQRWVAHQIETSLVIDANGANSPFVSSGESGVAE